jgi:putative endonuclease
LYIGVTSNLVQRVWQHKNGDVEGFTNKYKVNQLVWYERHEDAENAIKRERNMKEWKRQWKIELIEEANPYWHDLYRDVARRTNV